MKIKEKPSRILFLIIDVIVLLLITYACLMPIWHMVMASISNPTSLNTHPGIVYFPLKNTDFNAYRIILQYKKLWSAYSNTIVYIICTCVLTAVLTTIAGYIFSRKRFYYRNSFMVFISFTMLFNGGMIPNYIVMKGLNLTDNPLVMIIPGSLSVFNIIIMRTSMENVPASLEEAARIDGANAWQTLWKVTIPNVMPSITICTFLTLTNSFKLFDQNLALTAGRPFIQNAGETVKTTEMLALNIYSSFYASTTNRGVGQAKAVIFFVLVAAISILQLSSSRKKEVQQ